MAVNKSGTSRAEILKTNVGCKVRDVGLSGLKSKIILQNSRVFCRISALKVPDLFTAIAVYKSGLGGVLLVCGVRSTINPKPQP